MEPEDRDVKLAALNPKQRGAVLRMVEMTVEEVDSFLRESPESVRNMYESIQQMTPDERDNFSKELGAKRKEQIMLLPKSNAMANYNMTAEKENQLQKMVRDFFLSLFLFKAAINYP